MKLRRASAVSVALVVMSLPSGLCAQQKGIAGVATSEQRRTEGTRRWAILVGVNRYEDELGIGSLKYCAADMALLHQVLTGPLGGFRKENVLMMTDQATNPLHRPTYSNLVNMIPRWLADVEAEDDVVIAFSGHGIAADGQCHLLPSDAKRGALRLTSVSAALLREWLVSCKAKRKVLLLDACHSGAGKALGRQSEEWAKQLGGGQGFARLSSCDTGQKSNEDASLGHGVFTYYLAEGLRGDGDLDRDGRVGVSEAYRYVAEHVQRWARAHGLRQDPTMSGRLVGGQLTLAYVAKQPAAPSSSARQNATATLSLAVSPANAQVRVDGEVVALGGNGTVVSLAVTPGPHRVEVAKTGHVPIERSVSVPNNGVSGTVRLAPIVTRVTVHLKAGRQIFGELVSEVNGVIQVRRVDGRGTFTLGPDQYERFERGEVMRGESSFTLDLGRPTDATGGGRERRLPPGCEGAFMLPDRDRDQHGNPVTTRSGRLFESDTGWAYEMWLREPRMEFVLVPSGEFMMGSPEYEEGRDDDEGPVHRVHITKPFYLAKYETTVGQFGAFVRATGHQSDPEKGEGGNVKGPGKKWQLRRDANWRNPPHRQSDSHPVVLVSWGDALAFCQWLGSCTSVEVRLPTEAEWEYACRAGSQTRFHYGEDPGFRELGRYAWYEDNARGKLRPVGQKTSNPWGLLDMHGGVGELCLDRFGPYSNRRSRQTDPRGPSTGDRRIIRGGCWLDEPKYTRAANRSGGPTPHTAYTSTGFRCSLALRSSQHKRETRVGEEFAYGYYLVSPETYERFETHVQRIAPYTNVAVVYKGHLDRAMPVLGRSGIKALIFGFAPSTRGPDKTRDSFRRELLPVWRKHREHILAVYLYDGPYSGSMTPDELRDSVKLCKKACPGLPVLINFYLSPGSGFWRRQNPVPQQVDMVSFDHYPQGTPDEVRSRTLYELSTLRRLSQGKPVFVCGRSMTGRLKNKPEHPPYGPLSEAEAEAYRDAAVQGGAAGLIWAFYDAAGWPGLHGACFSPNILPVHERISRSLGVRKLK